MPSGVSIGLAAFLLAAGEIQGQDAPSAEEVVAGIEKVVSHVPFGSYDVVGWDGYDMESGSISFVRGKFVHLLMARLGWDGTVEIVVTRDWVYHRRATLSPDVELEYEAWRRPVADSPLRVWWREEYWLMMARAAPELMFAPLGPLACARASTTSGDEVVLLRKRWPAEPEELVTTSEAIYPVYVDLGARKIVGVFSDLGTMRAAVVDAPASGDIQFPKTIDDGHVGLVSMGYRYRSRENSEEPEIPAWTKDPMLSADRLGLDASITLEIVRSKHPNSEIAWELLLATALKDGDAGAIEDVRMSMAEAGVATPLTSLVGLMLDGRAGRWERIEEVFEKHLKSSPIESAARPWLIRARAERLSPADFAAWLREATEPLELEDRLEWARAVEQIPNSLLSRDLPLSDCPPVLHMALARQAVDAKDPKAAAVRFGEVAKRAEWLPAIRSQAAKVAEQEPEENELCDALVESGTPSLVLAQRYLKRRADAGRLDESRGALERVIAGLKEVRLVRSWLPDEFLPGEGAGAFLDELRAHELDDLAEATLREALHTTGAAFDARFKEIFNEKWVDDPEGAFELIRENPHAGSSLGPEFEEQVRRYAALGKEKRYQVGDADVLYERREWFVGHSGWEDAVASLAEAFPEVGIARELKADLLMMNDDPAGALDEYERAAKHMGDPRRRPEDSWRGFRSGFSLHSVETEPAVPEFDHGQPLWLKLAIAAHQAQRKDRGIDLLNRYARPGSGDFSYQAVGRAYLILGAGERALRHFWLGVLTREDAVDDRVWTFAFPFDEVARIYVEEKKWEDLWIVAAIARRGAWEPHLTFGGRGNDYSKEAIKERLDRYEREAVDRMDVGALVSRLVEENPEAAVSPELKKKADARVRELSSDDAGVRDSALQAMKAMGPSIAAILAPSLESSDPDVVSRARVLMQPWALEALLKRRMETLPWP